MLFIISKEINLSFYVLSKQWLIWTFLYNRLLAIIHCKAHIIQSFCIFINLLNYLSCGNILPTHTSYTILSTKVVSNSNKVNNGLGFWNKSIECLETLFNIPKLKLLLGLNFKIVTIRCVFTIIISLTDIKSFKKIE